VRGSALPRIGVGVAATAAWLFLAAVVLADSPAPSQAVSGDPRAGQAAGFVGNPALAIAIVVLVVVTSVAVTLAWVRATGGPARPDDKAR
jgi:hypothetical protein